MNPLKALVHAMGRAYCRRVCRDEYAAQKRPNVNERPIEYGFVLRALVRCHPAKVLDVGTGRTALASLIAHCGYVVAATDNVRDYWPHGMFNRHYHVIDDDITDTKLTEKFDLIKCVSVLEHILEPADLELGGGVPAGDLQALRVGIHAHEVPVSLPLQQIEEDAVADADVKDAQIPPRAEKPLNGANISSGIP